MNFTHNRIMIVGTGSGCGKTTMTCAVLKALVNRGLNVASFKCGPDYIDPMFHSKVIGAKSRNLDLFLCKEEVIKHLFHKTAEGRDISIIEGVMGMYDGYGGTSDLCSANHVAKVTNTPEILVLNTKGLSLSVAAVISGYKNFLPNNLRGVILNNTSKGMYTMLKDIIETTLPNIKVYGYLPPINEAQLGSRHLGLITADEVDDLSNKLELLAKAAEESIDLDGIMALAEEYNAYECDILPTPKPYPSNSFKIAVAMDKAFCFYYEDNFDLLREMGAELVPFSPLYDNALPKGIQGIILGGGYPEEYAKELSQNTTMLNSIKSAIMDGVPTIAECGGFMYLHTSIKDKEENSYTMVNAISGECYMTDKLIRFGYTTLTAKNDIMTLNNGDSINCHEFHFSDSTNNGCDITASKRGKQWECIHADKKLFAGYPHVHMWSNLSYAEGFIKSVAEYEKDTN